MGHKSGVMLGSTVRNVTRDIELALELADQADAQSMAVYSSSDFRYTMKPDGTPTIAVETSIEDGIRNLLARERPEDGILGEEGGQSGDTSTRWIVDPIDGTRVFIAGGREWGTQIALQVDGSLRLGVTSAPALGARWWGATGFGAWTKTSAGLRPLLVSRREAQQRLRWSCHPPLAAIRPDWRQKAESLNAIGDYVSPNPHAVLMVLEGTIEVAIQMEGAPWDYAAFAAIFQSAGGRFSYTDASATLAGIRPALFTNGVDHHKAVDALAPALTISDDRIASGD